MDTMTRFEFGRRVWGVLVGLAALVGCSDGEAANPDTSSTTSSHSSTSGGSGGGGGGAGGGDLTIEWLPCPLDSNQPFGADAECAAIDVPAFWDEPGRGVVTFFVKRKLASVEPSRGQAWFLNGGPGYSGADFESLAQNIAEVSPDVDVYMPDHRGVGRSSRLSCASAEDEASDEGANISIAEMPACLDELGRTWGERLDGFTMTQAARDVGEVIARTRSEGQFVLVYGGSYGSAWANRYLQIYPDQPDAAILDAIAINSRLSDIDRWFDGLGKRWMDLCAADATCGSKLGSDPWATMTAALEGLEGGACPEVSAMGFDRRLLQSVWASFFYDATLRPAIAPLVYRLARCAPEDVDAFATFSLALGPPPSDTKSTLFSLILSAHVSLSEFWEVPAPALRELEAFRDTANVAHGLATQFAAYDTPWPRHPLDEHAGKLAETGARLLLLHGEYDFIPMSAVQPVVDHFEGPRSTFVIMPGTTHSTFQSPTSSGLASCGGHLLKLMIDDPTAAPDLGCVGEVLPPSFELDPGYAPALFGSADAWEGGAAGPPPAAPPPLEVALRRVAARRP
jgi:pimeloyl-ACP methyl ester carboxylesterase